MTGKQKRFLRAMGHQLKPIVQLGKSRITDNLVDQLNENLRAHELIKVKLLKISGPERKELAQAIAEASSAELVQVLGGTVLLYKEHPTDPTIKLPK